MTLTQIKYFITAAETLSFTKAASRLFVSQQVVSRQIQLLEKDLGFLLFERNNKTFMLTDSGKLLYSLWSRHLKETEQTVNEALLLNHKKRCIRVGILEISNVIDMILPKIKLLNERFPNISWDYYLGNFAEIEHAVDTSSIDLAVTLSTELSKKHPKDQELFLQPLKLGIFVGSSHPLYHQESLSIKELEEETFFLFSEDISYDATNKVLTDCKQHGYYPKNIKYFSNINQMEFALLSGKGIFIGYDIFFRSAGINLKKFPLQPLETLEESDLIVAWRYPELKMFAQVFFDA